MNNVVSFPVAKLLEQKSYDGPSLKAYMQRNESHKLDSYKGILVDAPLQCDISAPIIADVLIWFYNKRKLWLIVDFNLDNHTWYFKITDTIIGSYDSVGDFDSPDKAYEIGMITILNTFL